MTLIKFTQVKTLEDGQRFYYFSDQILGQFHAFKVTAESTQILEQQKEDKDYLGLFAHFDKKLWQNLIDYLNPRDLFKMVVATRNMNGLYSINQLRNSFVYLRNPHLQQTAVNDFHSILGCLNQLNKNNHELQTGSPALKIPLLQLYIRGKKPPLAMIIPYLSSFAGDLKVVYYDHCFVFARGEPVVDNRDMLANTQGRLPITPFPNLNGLLRLDLNASMLNRNILGAYIQKAPNLMHLGLIKCVFDESWGMAEQTEMQVGFSEGVSLENLHSLDLSFSTIHPPAFFAFLRIAKNLEHLDISGTLGLANMDFNAFAQLSLPSLKSFKRRGPLPWSLGHLRALMSAVPNLKKLDLGATDIDDHFFAGLQPKSFGGIEELNLSDSTINDNIVHILKAAPCLKKLSLECTNLNLTITPGTHIFPGIHSLDVFSSTIKWTDLSILLRMMPNLKELDIEQCCKLEKHSKTSIRFPITTLEKIKCSTADLDEYVLEFLLRIAPNLKHFPLDFDSEFYEDDEATISPFEQDVMKYCRLAAKGYKIIQDALELYMKESPERASLIEMTLADEMKEFKSKQAFEENAKKHALQDREDSSSKRQKPSDD